jgi:lysophospholipase L1-like esterase
MRFGGVGGAVLLVGAVGAAGVYASWDAVSPMLGLQPAFERKARVSTHSSIISDAHESVMRQPVRVALHGNLVAEPPIAPAPHPVRVAAVDTAPPVDQNKDVTPVAPLEAGSDEDANVTPTLEGRAKAALGKRGLVILQIGDSHTAADFLTGELRRRLQARYGRGAPGYFTAGRPHIGVRTDALKITASAGWNYRSLQKPDAAPMDFWLSGYNAIASAPGEVMTFSADRPQTFERIEIEALRQPGGGAIDVKLDGMVETTYSLVSSKREPVVIRLLPARGATEKMREISIKTKDHGHVSIASVAIYNKRSGVTYNSIGYPGAQASLVNKFSSRLLANDLIRINPQIVVLSFGTNEAFNPKLELASYAEDYERVVEKIKSTLPGVVIVVIGPPDFAVHAATNGSSHAGADDCGWHTPARIAEIRKVQHDIAERHGLVYWNWASIMPSDCGAHRWATASPQLMAKDHVHFTIAGYKRSADKFLNTLIPVIERVRVGANVISHN